jgi:hypothetical protein
MSDTTGRDFQEHYSICHDRDDGCAKRPHVSYSHIQRISFGSDETLLFGKIVRRDNVMDVLLLFHRVSALVIDTVGNKNGVHFCFPCICFDKMACYSQHKNS